MKLSRIVLLLFLIGSMLPARGQKVNDVTTPLHLLHPDYPFVYGVSKVENIEEVLSRIYKYLDEVTLAKLINKNSGETITDYSKIDGNVDFASGDFRLTSYEWGVTYAGMLLANEATGNKQYFDYVDERFTFLVGLYSGYQDYEKRSGVKKHPMTSVLHPHALDDAGAICTAMIKAKIDGCPADLDPMINNFIDYITNKQYRFSDGTFARNRPQQNSLWLDDLFMSVPALAYMGKYTGDTKYYDDAVKQVLQFSERMFNNDKRMFMHGWVQGMEEHPQFHWGRANGWAVMSMVELLEVLPEDYPDRGKILNILRQHIKGLAVCQDGSGLWHQLLDRDNTYLETSASAIYIYSIARAINRGYIDAKAYAPMVCLAWNAVAEKVNDKGQVEGTCVETGMGFDPAFYYYRPINVYAAHGYGPLLLAGAEMIKLVKTHEIRINDSATMLL